jgi:hypothetical protein
MINVPSRNFLTFLAAALLSACASTNPDDAGYGTSGQAGGPSRPGPSRDTTGPGDPSSEGSGHGQEGCNNGFDEDGDGLIDEGCPCTPGDKQYCYVGDLAYGGVGACSWGTQTCELTGGTEFDTGAWGPCEGYGLPSEDVCDGADNDCDGMVDEDCACVPGSTQKCGTNNGACHFGEQVCDPEGTWGACLGGSSATSEVCNGMDDDCDGQIDEGLSCQCMPGMQEPCGLSTGECAPGNRVCQADGSWSACVGALLPKPEVCNGLDDDCDGIVDPGCQCAAGSTMPCNLYPNVGVCHDGQIVCQPGGTWSSCTNAQGPTPEVCDDGLDNDCDGEVDEGCTITLTLRIVGLNNDAMFEDCLFVRIAGGAAHPIGCNHDAGMVGKQVSFQLPGPACYEVGFEMTIDNAQTVRTVAVGGAEDHRWKVLDQTPIRVEFEDSTDNDYNDFQFTVEMDRTYFGIKGRPIGCK